MWNFLLSFWTAEREREVRKFAGEYRPAAAVRQQANQNEVRFML